VFPRCVTAHRWLAGRHAASDRADLQRPV